MIVYNSQHQNAQTFEYFKHIAFVKTNISTNIVWHICGIHICPQIFYGIFPQMPLKMDNVWAFKIWVQIFSQILVITNVSTNMSTHIAINHKYQLLITNICGYVCE